MLPFTKINPDPRFQPIIDDVTCRWLLPQDFNENTGLASLGKLQEFLKNDSIHRCELDFSDVTWADPQPLLCLGLVLAESSLAKSQITIGLGNIEDGNRDHLTFLKFFASQGFFLEFASHAQFQHDGIIDDNIDEMRFRLSNIQHPSYFLNSDCIFAKIIKVDQYQNDTDKLQNKVEEFLREAKDRSSQNAFGSDPLAREILFQKIRNILYELLLNVAEHSHSESVPSYAGVYARIRAAKPPVHSDATAWLALFEKKTLLIFGQRSFSPNHYAEWLELFVCDVGVGLTHHIQQWPVPENDPQAAKMLQQAKGARNQFFSIVDQLFHAPFSSHPRHSAQRTAVTGLQHLGHFLSIDEDHCRIYTQKGSWAGDHFPWQEKQFSRRDIKAPTDKINQPFFDLTPVSGTAYAFSIHTDYGNLMNKPPWVTLDQGGQQKILKALRERSIFDGDRKKVVWFDRRGKDNCTPPQLDELPDPAPDVIILRPPRLVNKQDIAKWLDLVAGNSLEPAKKPAKLFILAELTPFQTVIFYELLQHVVVHRETKQDWYLVSEQWAVFCLTTSPGKHRFNPSKQKAGEFLVATNGQLSFTSADLAVLLREMDSEIFWGKERDHGRSPFFDEPVDWESAHGDKQPIRLRRYLDFPLALVNPDRYTACLRALRRCLALFPDHNPKGADDLVASLVREASLTLYKSDVNAHRPDILVGSVAVTEKTVENILSDNKTEFLHILIHKDVEGMPNPSSLAVLLWISQLSTNANETFASKPTHQPPWRRIPNTPYIAPLGEKSISVLRYRENSDGSLNFNDPYYPRTPENTYNDFQRLGILKTGHWVYGSRHDLLTVNMRLAIRFSLLEKGPLYLWLEERFTEYFFRKTPTSKAIAQFLLYPSHPITDMLLDHIRRDPGFQNIDPEGGMIPIKFVTKRTVSPLLASHLIEYRINQVIEEKKWKNGEWAAVLLDDGIISGKHLRETTQFLQALGASTVYTIVLLDRSGLPVQEKVIDTFFRKHKRFWRWDVPGLGNRRNCPLCQAITIIQTYAPELASNRQKSRLKEWMRIWQVRNVDLEWYGVGLQPTAIDPPLEITFGIDPGRGTAESPVEKRLSFISSSAATSLLMELTRLTTRTDVTVKKAEQILSVNPDAAIEIVASQLFLFMDELSAKEKLERFKKLLEWPWEKEGVTDAMSLAGLCFTLVDDELVEVLWKYCKETLLTVKLMRNLDTILSVSILCSRHEFLTEQQYKLSDNANEVEIDNYLLLCKRVNLRQDIGALLKMLLCNPKTPSQAKSHQTALKKTLDKFAENGNLAELNLLANDILPEMKVLHEILSRLLQERVLKNLEDELNQLAKDIQLLDKAKQSNVQELKLLVENLQELLYGDSAIVKKVQEQMFCSYKNFEDFDNGFIAPITRKLQQDWEKLIIEKINLKFSGGYSNSEWYKMDYWLIEENRELSLLNNKPLWNGEQPIFLATQNSINEELWFYCDSHVKTVLENVLANVLHATDKIVDPYTGNSAGSKAHLWWCADIEEDFFVFKTANVTKNKEIFPKQRVSVACLERAGGSVKVKTEEASKETFIAYTELRLPLFKFFIGEKQ